MDQNELTNINDSEIWNHYDWSINSRAAGGFETKVLNQRTNGYVRQVLMRLMPLIHLVQRRRATGVKLVPHDSLAQRSLLRSLVGFLKIVECAVLSETITVDLRICELSGNPQIVK